MEEQSPITAAVAAKLLGITPGELDALARENIIPRIGRDSYQVAPVVQGYLAYLRGEIQRKKDRPTQQEMARLFDMSERAFRDLLGKLGMDHKEHPRDAIITAAISYYREQAAGRLGLVETYLDIVAERARESKEKADGLAMKNAQTRGELIDRQGAVAAGVEFFRLLRDRVMGVPTQIAPLLASMADPWEVEQKMRDALRQTMADVAAAADSASLEHEASAIVAIEAPAMEPAE